MFDSSITKHRIADKLSSFIAKPGQHILLTGATGSGKTTQLYYLIRFFLSLNETIIFRDTGKASESLYLSNFKDLNYLVPEGCNIRVRDNSVPIEVSHFSSFDELFGQISQDKINIISESRFLLDPVQWSVFWSDFFHELVRRGLAETLPTPLCVVIDELSQLCPSSHHRIDKRQSRLSAFVAKNVEQLRGVDIRLLGTSQGWTKLSKPVRISFQYYIFKRVAERIDIDMHALKKTNYTIQSLRPDQFVLLVPEKFYSNPYSLPDLGIAKFTKNKRLKYEGELSFEWECETKLKRKKDTGKLQLEGVKELARMLYEKRLMTQEEIGEVVGRSQQTISEWIKEAKKKEIDYIS